MPITCSSGFSNYWPPFVGNVRIRNFRLSKDTAKAGEEVHALGKAEIKKFTPLNPWNPFTNRRVNIKWAWAGVEREVTARGKTDGNGKFDITFTGPYVTKERTVELWASLPEPSGKGGKHLECGPLELRALPGKKKPEGREKTKRLAAYVVAGSVAGVGLGWLATR